MAMILRITYTPRNSKRAITASVAQPTRVCQSMDMACGSISFKMSMSTMGRAPTTQACSFPWAVREPILACIRSRLRIVAEVRSRVSARPPPVSLAMRMAEVMSTVVCVGMRWFRLLSACSSVTPRRCSREGAAQAEACAQAAAEHHQRVGQLFLELAQPALAHLPIEQARQQPERKENRQGPQFTADDEPHQQAAERHDRQVVQEQFARIDEQEELGGLETRALGETGAVALQRGAADVDQQPRQQRDRQDHDGDDRGKQGVVRREAVHGRCPAALPPPLSGRKMSRSSWAPLARSSS